MEGAVWTTGVTLLIALGGSEYHVAALDRPAQLVAVAMIALALALPARQPWRFGLPDGLILALLALFAAHLVPLPPHWWAGLPGRELAVAIDQEVFGSALWRPLSLDPDATWRSLFALLPPLAVYLALRRGGRAQRQAMLRGLACGLALAGGFAMLQGVSGQAAWAYPHPQGQNQFLSGLFANHNHQATFLNAGLPLALLWLGGVIGSPRLRTALWLVLILTVAMLVLASASRAGASLLLLAMAGCCAVVASHWGWRWSGGRARRLGLAMAGLAGLSMVVGAFVLLGAERLLSVAGRSALGDDLRLGIWPTSWNMAGDFIPTGSGLGSFPMVYQALEPLDTLTGFPITHAHNDYIQVLLEAGLPGIILAALLLGWIGWHGARAWLDRQRHTSPMAVRLASLSLAIPLLHALVDYPLRSGAVALVMAMALAILVADRSQSTRKA